jgi:DNA repair exonuclease SbcCD ATPase subunit
MHITRIELRHWRRHEHLLVEGLSERINLVCGRNESGKSSLAEALRHALFEPCKPVYDARKSLQSRSGSEAPEVSVDLDIDGQRWRIDKRFLKKQQTRLTGPDGRTLETEESERRLQELLGVSIPEAGRVTKEVDSRHLGLWPVLWLRQGQLAAIDGAVTDGVRARLTELVAREIGSVATGALGARALQRVQQEYERFWTVSTGKPTGEHARLVKERDAASGRRDQAQDRLRQFESAVRDLQETVDRLGGLAARQRTAEEQAESARTKARQAAERRTELERQRRALTEERHKVETVDRQVAQRRDLAKECATLQDKRDEQQAREAVLQAAVTHAERTVLDREQAAAAAHNTARAALDAAEHARQAAERGALERRLRRMADDLQRVLALADERRRTQAAAAALPEIGARTITGLRSKQTACREAAIARDAAATTVTFTAEQAITATWTADGSSETLRVATGSSSEHRTTSLGELRLDGIGTVRVRSGAGQAADLAEKARHAAEALDEALRKLGVASLEEAETRQQAHADALTADRRALAALQSALALDDDADAATIAAAVDAAQHELSIEQARLTALPAPAAEAMAADPDATRTAARAAQEAADDARRNAEAATRDLQTRRQGLVQMQLDAAGLIARIDRIADELARLPAVDELERQRDAAIRALGEAANRERELQAAYEALGGDAAADDADAQARVAKTLQDEVQKARQRRDQLQAQIRAAADLDPAAQMQEAETELARLQEQLRAAERHANAVRCLRETMLAVQRETRAALVAPVRQAVEPYLRRIFPQARLILGDEDWSLTGLVAPAGEEPFEQLSLGAQEQYALLVRLGLAEVFAQGRRLPLVLDDPLINADPARCTTMIKALRDAARKLQLIVFTCNEARHDSLAADRMVTLPGGRP